LLDRPLRVPALAPGDRCPVSAPHDPVPAPPSDEPGWVGGAAVLGGAPVAPLAIYFHPETTLVVKPPGSAPGWYAAKVGWGARVGFGGYVLIRAGRIDGPGRARVLLQDVTVHADATLIDVVADWQFWPGATEVTAPGCYAYQVDGAGFSEVIVFQATPG
jgi:hypothetical protein